jgi:predicted AlkP superfamily phosphohydrolase/phosphomutase/tetratricopeptide (TPR) repeat protein
MKRTPSSGKVLLVGWDGADWHIARPLMAAGRMPQLSDVVANGCHGAIESLPPFLSPMLWNTIATGKHPAEHGIIGFTECNATTGKIQPMSSLSRKSKALWNILSQEGRRCHVFGWFASHPAESINGRVVAETFAKFGKDLSSKAPATSVSPASDYEDLCEVRISPREVEKSLLQFFIPEVESIDLDRDPRPLKLLERLSELYTLHNCAVATLQDDSETDFLAVYYHFIDWICHDFMEYGPPRRKNVLERDFQLYSGVIDRAYELQDVLLRDLLQAAGPGAELVLVSDHGFLSGDERPEKTPDVTAGIAAWHRPQGIFALAGPAWKAGQELEGVTLFDVTPTLLHRFDLPVGEDMPGHVLTEAFRDSSHQVGKIESWETRGPPLADFFQDGMSHREASDLLQQFADLGYINLDRDPFETAEEVTRRENNWNLGQALISANRIEEALPHLEEAWFSNPEQAYLALPLARCQARLGLLEASKQTAETIRDFDGENPEVNLILADLHQLWGEHEEALDELDAAEARGGNASRIRGSRGLCLLHLERFEEAEAIFRALVQEEPKFEFRLGLCRALTRQGKVEEAQPLVDVFLRERPRNAIVWFTYGQLLDRKGQPEEAKGAFAKALDLEPGFLNAHTNLMLQEAALKQSRGEPVIWQAKGLDFRTGETELDRSRKLAQERVAALRVESHRRFEEWSTSRDGQREETGPLSKIEAQVKTSGPPGATEPITIVTGLPRSGTSMMMQILEAGGIPVKTDGVRSADDHNPQGYYEWEAIKDLQKHPKVIDEAAGMAVKVVSPQIPALPGGRTYQFIWMNRPVEEIADSQSVMLGLNDGEDESRENALTQHKQETLGLLRKAASESNHMKLLEVGYHESLIDPAGVIAKLVAFLGEAALPRAAQAAGVVDKRLHRSRINLEL